MINAILWTLTGQAVASVLVLCFKPQKAVDRVIDVIGIGWFGYCAYWLWQHTFPLSALVQACRDAIGA